MPLALLAGHVKSCSSGSLSCSEESVIVDYAEDVHDEGGTGEGSTGVSDCILTVLCLVGCSCNETYI